MLKPKIADEYLEIPNKILEGLGGASHLRDKYEGSAFEICHAWPSFPKALPFGLKFRFRKSNKYHIVQISTSPADLSRYRLDVCVSAHLRSVLFEDRLTLESALLKFFEFAAVEKNA